MRDVIAGLLLLIAAPAAARDLPVPPNKGWQHAASGLILTASLAGEHRTALTDSGNRELDVVAQYESDTGDTIATIYLFHPGLHDVSLWFDRIDTVIRERDIYGHAAPITAAPTAFARPGSAVTDSLRRAYLPSRGAFHATAFALMPLGEWLVSVRISSKTDAPEALDHKLDAIIGALRFPATAPAARPALPIADCTVHINYHHAKLMKPDMTQILLGAIVASPHDDQKVTTAPQPFCRDGAGTTDYGVYRINDATPAYWVAFHDAGQAAFVSGGVSGLLGKGGFQVSLLTFSGTDIFPSFDQLPEPKQIAALVGKGNPLSHAEGKNINISAGALR